MTEAEKQAFAIYEEMCAGSRDRPSSGNSIEELTRKLIAWTENSPAVTELRRAPAEVRLAFLQQSFGFLRAEAKDQGNFNLLATISDGIQIALRMATEPLPTPIVHQLLS